MPPAFVQSKGGTSNTLSSLPIAFTSNNTAGNLLVCSGVVNTPTIGGLTITDTQGNTWIIALHDTWNSISTFFMAYAPNCKAGANTVTIAQLGTLISGAISEYSGVSTTTPLDEAGFSDSGSGTWTTATSGNVTTRDNGELIVAAQANSTGPASVTLGSGFSNLQNDSGNFVSIESRVQATAGAIAGTFTISASSGACGVLTFVPTGETAFNVWVPQGTITLSGTTPEQPNVIYEGNAQILSGNVFKMWYQVGGANPSGPTAGMYYAESTDGINFTGFGSNPVLADAWGIKIFKNGSTYYCYYTTGISTGSTKILVATSTNGTTWVAQTPTNSITAANSAWSTTGLVFQLQPLDQVGGIWYGYYGGAVGSSLIDPNLYYPTGLATSPDLINWTPSAGNPITSMNTGTGRGSGNFVFAKINGVYYGWSQSVLPNEANAQQSTQPGQLPSDMFRWSATSVTGPWTLLGTGSTLNRTLTSEGVNSGNGQVADPSIVFDGTNTWMYYTGSINGATGTNYTVNAAKAASTTFAQLVATYEGVFNVPVSGNPSLNFKVLGSDTFQRANESPLSNGGKWSPVVSGSTANLVSDVVTNSTVSVMGDSYWNAVAWGADQWSQVTISAFTASGFLGPSVRQSTTGALTSYKFVGATTGSGQGTKGNWILQKVVAGVFTTLGTFPLTVSPGDVLTLVVIGTNLYPYYNGNLLGVFSDSSISSGAAGFNVDATSASPSLQANASISAWSGGTFQNAPALQASISGNAGVGGATVTYSGTSSGSVVADSFGNYILPNLVNGSYTITPSLAGYTFSPSSSSQTVSGTNITGVNFIASVSSGGSTPWYLNENVQFDVVKRHRGF